MKLEKNLSLFSKLCLGLALVITVYNYLIIESPVPNEVTGIILVLLIASNMMTSYKKLN